MKLVSYPTAIALCLAIMACSNGEEDTTLSSTNDLRIEFDNGYDTRDLLLGTTYDANGSEQITINTLKYLISNLRLEDEDGEVFTYPKNKSLFIIDEAKDASRFLSLADVPQGNYTKITFGIGVDQDQYSQGAEGQGDFLVQAQEEGMFWSWAAGYIFMKYEGTFTSDNASGEAYAIHMGSHGTAQDNYREVSLELPVSAKVRPGVIPEIHVKADVSKILGGPNALLLEDKSEIHVDPELDPQIAENLRTLFTVHHVHN